MPTAEASYRSEWAALTGRSPSDIYIPEAIREAKPVSDNPTVKFELTFDTDVVEVELEFKFSDNAEEFIDVTQFVNIAAHTLLNEMVGNQEGTPGE